MYKPLNSVLSRLNELDVVPKATARLTATLDEVEAELKETILDEIPAFTESANPDILPELGQHANDHLNEICRVFNGGIVGDFEFVRRHVRHRAEQRFPLEATLHAYRCGHKVIARWLRKATLSSIADHPQRDEITGSIADFAIEYTDCISNIATSEYVSATRLIAEAEVDRRAQLLSVLLKGYDESDRRTSALLRNAGLLDQRQSFCIVVSRPVDPTEMEIASRVNRLAESIAHVADATPVRFVSGVRDDHVVVIFHATRRLSGWTTPHSELSDTLMPALLRFGPAVLIGLSEDVPSTSHLPSAYKSALLALEFASVTERVVRIAEVPLRRILLRQRQEQQQIALPRWSDKFFAADDKARNKLSRTLKAYADADMNLSRTAEKLAVHPNTIYSRMSRIAEITGLDGQTYHGLTELLLTIDCRGGTT